MTARRSATAARLGLGAAALAAIVWCPLAADGAPLGDYHARLSEAIRAVDEAYVGDGGGSAPKDLARVRELLPPRETVEFGDASVEVDNAWLARELDAYDEASDAEVRSGVLERVAARLYAEDAHLDALDAAPAHATAEDRAKLEEILSRPEFRSPAESPLAKSLRELRRRVGRFLSDLLEKIFGGGRGASLSTGIRVVVIAAGALGLLLLARAVAGAIARRGVSGKRDKLGKRKKTRTVLGEEVDESTTATDIADAARELAAAGDFRGAVRKLFVALIYHLDERGLVRLRAEATNREYLALVREVGTLYPVMTSMTDVFERVWYGEEPVDRAAYETFQSMYTGAVEIVERQSAAHSP